MPDRGFQFSAPELVRALEDLRLWTDPPRPPAPEQYWERAFDDGLTREESDAIYDVKAS
jgi:hypothetical protein